MGLFDIFKPKNSALNQGQIDAIKELGRMTTDPEYSDLFKELGKAISVNEGSFDELQNSKGVFGFSKTNPILARSVMSSEGAEHYFSGLLYNNKPVVAKRTGSVSADEVTKKMIDAYEILSEGKHVTTLYVCPYFKRNSRKPPPYFLFAKTGTGSDGMVARDVGLFEQGAIGAYIERLQAILGVDIFKKIATLDMVISTKVMLKKSGPEAVTSFLLEVHPREITPENVSSVVRALLAPTTDQERAAAWQRILASQG